MHEDTLPKVLMNDDYRNQSPANARLELHQYELAIDMCECECDNIYLLWSSLLSFSLLNFIQIFFQAVLGQGHSRRKSSMSATVHHLLIKSIPFVPCVSIFHNSLMINERTCASKRTSKQGQPQSCAYMNKSRGPAR